MSFHIQRKRRFCLGFLPLFSPGILLVAGSVAVRAQSLPEPPLNKDGDEPWNWHVQNTDIIQGTPAFAAQYSGPNSLDSEGEIKETVSFDLFAGVKLWTGAEAHADFLVWQGYGLSDAHGIEAFPNGDAFKVGTSLPNANIARIFIRQTIGLGGEQETIADSQLWLASKQDISRVTITVGRFSAKDIFDNNSYANDPRTQFMDWALMANEAWDYPADSLGYATGMTLELNQKNWTARYGFFQVPPNANGEGVDPHFLKAWAMVAEYERRWTLQDHKGAARVLAYMNSAYMGSYQEAINGPIQPADIAAVRAYRLKYGFGLNVEQEVAKNIGLFSRLGWSDGETESWMFSDVDRSVSLGVSIKGEAWCRPGDTYGLAGILSGIAPIHQQFFADGGLGILAGDGALNYSWEKAIETYYDCQVWKSFHVAVDYMFVTDPAFNRARGPVSVFAARLHWEF